MSTVATTLLGTVKIKCTCTPLLLENLDRISVLFAARLEEPRAQNIAKDDLVSFEVHSLAPSGCERAPSADFITRLQVGVTVFVNKQGHWKQVDPAVAITDRLCGWNSG
ncbi:hypothetical protein Zmor_024104 [Zophobas morio]|uniref:Uncharacterized protein n=1 Tax=Zophobas morio TaxID=2755281 RepID=A0AA38HZJ7_9CUCU|nr:hypothetical protein Zmor_024104 [Zophobas morio]